MSELTDTTRHSGLGKPLLWLVLLLTVALLSYVTAVAVQNNPLYSDRDANGISKYLFIEECKERAREGDKLEVGAMGQTMPLKTLIEQGSPLTAGDRIVSVLEAESAQIIRSTEAVQGGGWTLTAPVTISIENGTQKRTLGQLPMQCAYSKKDGKTTASLELPGQ